MGLSHAIAEKVLSHKAPSAGLLGALGLVGGIAGSQLGERLGSRVREGAARKVHSQMESAAIKKFQHAPLLKQYLHQIGQPSDAKGIAKYLRDPTKAELVHGLLQTGEQNFPTRAALTLAMTHGEGQHLMHAADAAAERVRGQGSSLGGAIGGALGGAAPAALLSGAHEIRVNRLAGKIRRGAMIGAGSVGGAAALIRYRKRKHAALQQAGQAAGQTMQGAAQGAAQGTAGAVGAMQDAAGAAKPKLNAQEFLKEMGAKAIEEKMGTSGPNGHRALMTDHVRQQTQQAPTTVGQVFSQPPFQMNKQAILEAMRKEAGIGKALGLLGKRVWGGIKGMGRQFAASAEASGKNLELKAVGSSKRVAARDVSSNVNRQLVRDTEKGIRGNKNLRTVTPGVSDASTAAGSAMTPAPDAVAKGTGSEWGDKAMDLVKSFTTNPDVHAGAAGLIEGATSLTPGQKFMAAARPLAVPVGGALAGGALLGSMTSNRGRDR